MFDMHILGSTFFFFKDYTSRINDPSIYPELVSKAKQIAAEAVKMSHDVANGIYLENIEILSPSEGNEIRNQKQQEIQHHRIR